MAQWVDFDYVKTHVSIKDVLGHYGLLKESTERHTKHGTELRIRCPFHQDKAPSFSANLETGRFHCFGCHAKGGDIFDFVVLREELDTGKRDQDRRQAALTVQEWFGITSPRSQEEPAPVGEQSFSDRVAEMREESRKTKRPRRHEPAKDDTTRVINPPLGFELKRVDVEAGTWYAVERGLTPEIAETFGLAVALSGGYKGRLVIPLHDHNGVLVGYAARALDDSEPKYLFPSSDKGFYKSHLVYNLWRVVPERPRSVVVTEGFFDVMKVVQAGYPAVGLMGSSLSERQAELLCEHFRHLVIMMDGDEAGRRAIEECLSTLGRRRYVRAVEVPEGLQPDLLDTENLHELLRYG
jgi:DNA primase